MSKVYLLWKKDMTEWSDVPDYLVGIYKNKSDAELDKKKLSGEFNKEIENSDVCLQCPACECDFNIDEAKKYCKEKLNKIPDIKNDKRGPYCCSYNSIPMTNDEYSIDERELIE